MSYYVTQQPRKHTTTEVLFLADRTKTKAMWWTGSLGLAISFTSKDAALFTASRLKFNEPIVVDHDTAMRAAKSNAEARHEKEQREMYHDHPFSSDGLGQS